MRTTTMFPTRGLGLIMTLCLAALPLACDKGGEGKAEEAAKGEDKAPAESQMAQDANKAVEEIKAELEKGEDVKYSCAGNLGMFGDLAKSEDEAEKKAFAALQQICYVDAPRKLIADLTAKMEKGELDTFDTVDLSTVIEADDFPKEGEFAKVTEEANKLLQVDVPVYSLKQAITKAKAEKEEGKTVSMGCIEGQQVVDKSGEKIAADAEAKKTLDEFTALCPKDK